MTVHLKWEFTPISTTNISNVGNHLFAFIKAEINDLKKQILSLQKVYIS